MTVPRSSTGAKLGCSGQPRGRPLLVSLVTRLLIVASAWAALAVQLWLASHAATTIAWSGAAAFAIGFVSGRASFAPGYWLLLGGLYLFPAAIYPFIGVQPGFTGVATAGAFGLALGAKRGANWSLPPAWALALGFTALAVALTWPVIALREIDFTAAQLFAPQGLVTWKGPPPHVQVAFLTGVAAVHMVGILLVDGLVGRFRANPREFRRLVLAPLAATAVIAGLVTLYQMDIDVTFLNPWIFAQLGRASGTMLDANSFGTIAAMWAVGAAWLLAQSGRPLAVGAAPAAAALLAAAVWGTGSRTAALALVVGALFLGAATIRAFRSELTLQRAVPVLAGLAAALALVAAVAVRSDVVGPWSRLGEIGSSGASMREVVTELRDRGAYGQSARFMIADFPWTGTGVGTFHALVVDYAWRHLRVRISHDNAQNWFRHQVAEIGWIGSAGYFAWVGVFAVFVGRRLWRGDPTILAAGGVLAGVLAASLFGTPTQEVSVALTFWVFVAWVAIAAGAAPPPGTAPRGWSAATAAAALLAVIYAAGTAYLAADRLRVPQRAAETGWAYQYGLSPFELSEPGYVRWMTARHSVAVFERIGRYVHLRFEVHHPDLTARPVDVEVKLRGRTVLRTKLRSPGLVEGYLELRRDDPFVRLEFLVDRTFTDPVTGAQRGLLLHPFTFVDEALSDTWRFR